MSSLDQNQGAFSHWDLGNLRNGQKERGERKKGDEGGRAGRKKERESDARTSVSHHLKRESQQLRKAHWTENTTPSHTHTHTHRWGCAFLQVPCINPQWKITERKERVCLYVCKIERGVVEDYKGYEKQKEWWENWEKRDNDSWKEKVECVIQKKNWHENKLLNSGAKTPPDLWGSRE